MKDLFKPTLDEAPDCAPPIELEQMIIEERLRCRWGARKLKKVLEQKFPDILWTAKSTVR